MNALEKIIASATSSDTNVTSSSKKKPKGYVKVSIGGMSLFSRPVWAESTSDDDVVNELNDLCLADKDAAAKVIKQLLQHVEVEITTPNQTSAASLADLIKATTK